MPNSSGKPVVAIDFDDTWTAMTRSFALLKMDLENEGATVLIVSCRADDQENREDIESATGFRSGKVLLTSGSPKRWFAEQRGWSVDIWIDDQPETILYGR